MAQNRSILFKASDLIPSYFYQFVNIYLRYWYKIVEIVTLRVNIAHSTCQNFISNVKILFLGSVVRSQNSGTKIRCYENKPPVPSLLVKLQPVQVRLNGWFWYNQILYLCTVVSERQGNSLLT